MIGDADHGVAVEQGMKAAAEAAQAAEGTLRDIFNAAAKGFLNAVGASSGPLYATALLRAGKAAGPRASMPTGELRTIIAAMRDGIAQRGKAEPGQRTMLDAWGPAADAAVNGRNADAIAAAAAGRGSDARHDRNRRSRRASRRALARPCGPRLGLGRNAGRRICRAIKIA
ncbi:MAG: DAK2 domain-containing protein [Mesorhizobium sp.]|nr:MAG: DAK2 domain-containing protein [Mesorhizobium sp.]